MNPKITVGRLVLFTLSLAAVASINDQRARSDGSLRGNSVQVGEVYPMLVSRVWPETTYADGSTVNGQVLLDGNDSLWVTSVHLANEPTEGCYHWPAYQPKAEDISPEVAIDAIAGDLYETYCKEVGGLAFNGDPLPDWRTFRDDPSKTKQSNAWVAVAERSAGVVRVA